MNCYQQKFRHDQESRRVKSACSPYNAEALVLGDSNHPECRISLRHLSWCQEGANLNEESVWFGDVSRDAHIPITCRGWQCTRVNAKLRIYAFSINQSRPSHIHLYYHRNALIFLEIKVIHGFQTDPTDPVATTAAARKAERGRSREAQRVHCKVSAPSPSTFARHRRLIDSSLASIILIVIPMTSTNIVMSSCQSPCSK